MAGAAAAGVRESCYQEKLEWRKPRVSDTTCAAIVAAQSTPLPILPIMPFHALAVVELQLIMQCCDATTLLRFAQSCRTTRHAAGSDFAWKYMPHVPLLLPRCRFPWMPDPPASPPAEPPDLLHRLLSRVFKRSAPLSEQEMLLDALQTSPVLRHLPLSVSWSNRGVRPTCPTVQPPAVLSALARLPHIVELALVSFPYAFAGEGFGQILQLPVMAHVTSLRMEPTSVCAVNYSTLPVLSPLLQKLILTQGVRKDPLALGWLPAMAQLTDLRLEMGRDSEDALQLEHVGQCTHLRRLRLAGPTALQYTMLLRAPALQRSLEFLSLWIYREHYADDPEPAPPDPEWTACFAQLQTLHTLRLSLTEHNPNDLLHAIACARPPSLRAVVVKLATVFRAVVPSAAAVEELLAALPDVTLSLRCTVTPYPRSFVSPSDWEEGIGALRSFITSNPQLQPRMQLQVRDNSTEVAALWKDFNERMA